MLSQIDTFIINLEKRIDRRGHILNQFAGKTEFNVNIVKAIIDDNGALGLWLTLKSIIVKNIDKPFIVVCEDDHTFTKNYDAATFLDCVQKAAALDADILLGGVSWFNDTCRISSNFFWVDMFTGLQFTIIYKRFYTKILLADFTEIDVADKKISTLTKNKFIVHPFISVQKEFGYSDITFKNNTKGYVSKIFKKAISVTNSMVKVNDFYRPFLEGIEPQVLENLDDYSLSTYIICSQKNKNSLKNTLSSFEGKPEFELNVINGDGWQSIVNIVTTAIANEDDLIVICTDKHVFSDKYCKENFFKALVIANEMGTNLLLGGVDKYGQAVYMDRDLYWIDYFQSAQFIVVYRDFFDTLLLEPNNLKNKVDQKLSAMTSKKMVIYPFISIANNSSKRQVDEMPSYGNLPSALGSDVRLSRVRELWEMYNT